MATHYEFMEICREYAAQHSIDFEAIKEGLCTFYLNGDKRSLMFKHDVAPLHVARSICQSFANIHKLKKQFLFEMW